MNHLLIHQADILTPATTQSLTTGAAQARYIEKIAGMKCLIQPRAAAEIDAYGKITARNAYRLYCIADQTSAAITEKDVVKFGGQTYRILGVRDAAGLGRHYEIDLEKII